ncbi:ATP-binding protein [Streptomyces sp. RPT161]|uniref:ATP-binding protein n=1 Tax=Streptomyces sp. RPT161 TaxID=3015993 RepID=UPI0022B86352|nr:ATP-binding protein [Streptomyces sp. RPT161]
MNAEPLFHPPAPSTNTTGWTSHADIIKIDTALEAMRDSGFDLTAAIGEPIDNSIEAGATIIQVLPSFAPKKSRINEIAILDNGRGIKGEILARVLSMGYSTRYGQRGSLGRFGVGMKLAGLSLGRRIDVYTKQVGDDAIGHAYLDIEEIAAGQQTHIEARKVDSWPSPYSEVMNSFDSGTLVVYGKIDRLTDGGHYGTSLSQKLTDLRTFISRTYRKFLDQGLTIKLNTTTITLLDPLFLLDNPRILKDYPDGTVRGRIIEEDDIHITNGHSIHVTVTTAPREFRWREGEGGHKDRYGRDIDSYQIPDSAGKISMVRNGREINYDIVPRLLPSGIDKIDRYIGIEVTFPAELDEFFQVRNVKRGAVPVDKLRSELRLWLDRPVRVARKEIRAHWGSVKTRERENDRQHTEATNAATRANKTAPMGQAGKNLTDEDTEQIVQELLHDLGMADDREQAEQVREQIQQNPFTLVDGAWPGKEMFEIDHLNGKAIIRLNHRHPFMQDIYLRLKEVADGGTNGADVDELVRLIRKTETALDILILAYAKAENMDPKTEKYEDLRSYWGQFTHSFMRELPNDE